MRTRVLVIQDNATHMALASALLEKLDCEVLRARSAEVGLALAREALPEVVLMDMRLPGMDGLAATRSLKADPATAHIKVIVLTSFRDEEAGSPFEAGADAFLSKPYHYQELQEVLKGLGVGYGSVKPAPAGR